VSGTLYGTTIAGGGSERANGAEPRTAIAAQRHSPHGRCSDGVSPLRGVRAHRSSPAPLTESDQRAIDALAAAFVVSFGESLQRVGNIGNRSVAITEDLTRIGRFIREEPK
jgi:hypothetical protein